ncbi:hypothetical protein CBS101457_000279 [Exobasidium rhododendri]|nr:hypothetical protein CBS101457_000279 [Exobasidium rhododendri]
MKFFCTIFALAVCSGLYGISAAAPLPTPTPTPADGSRERDSYSDQYGSSPLRKVRTRPAQQRRGESYPTGNVEYHPQLGSLTTRPREFPNVAALLGSRSVRPDQSHGTPSSRRRTASRSHQHTKAPDTDHKNSHDGLSQYVSPSDDFLDRVAAPDHHDGTSVDGRMFLQVSSPDSFHYSPSPGDQTYDYSMQTYDYAVQSSGVDEYGRPVQHQDHSTFYGSPLQGQYDASLPYQSDFITYDAGGTFSTLQPQTTSSASNLHFSDLNLFENDGHGLGYDQQQDHYNHPHPPQMFSSPHAAGYQQDAYQDQRSTPSSYDHASLSVDTEGHPSTQGHFDALVDVNEHDDTTQRGKDVDLTLEFHRPSKRRTNKSRRGKALVDPTINQPLDPHSLVWHHREADEHFALVDLVSRRRGYRYTSARKTLAAKLTLELEQGLLSRNLDLIDHTLAILFPIVEGTILPLWMQEKPEEDSERLVRYMQIISGRSKEVIRNYFLQSRLSSETAHDLLMADHDARVRFAVKTGLLSPTNHPKKKVDESVGVNAWQYDLSVKERIQIRDVVMKVFDRSENLAYKMLNQAHIYPGLTREILDSISQGQDQRTEMLFRYLEHGGQS